MDRHNESSSTTTSVVQYLGPSCSYCGYCKRTSAQAKQSCGSSGDSRRSYDMQTYSLRPSDYQALLDRNWRRSGTYSYCPINQKTCCPNYSIICSAIKFKLTRSQRKCIAKVNSYLASGTVGQDLKLNVSKNSKETSGNSRETSQCKVRKSIEEIKASSKLRQKRFLKSCERKSKLYGKSLEEAAEELWKKWNDKAPDQPQLESYLYPKKIMLAGREVQERPFAAKHVLKIDMIHVDSERSGSMREEQLDMLIHYQEVVHKESGEWCMSRFCNFLVETPLITERLVDFDYVPKEELRQGDTHSQDVHLSEASEYLLVRPPQLPTAYGTYHCNYYLDDKLIATGVLDVLPKCITTVYFFYNPSYDFLNLGIYSALVEISMIRQMNKHYISNTAHSENQLVNYYLGFYVHECKKMHYKTRFKPAYLLCSRFLCYVPLETCLRKLSDRKYADFSDTDVQQNSSPENAIQLSSFMEWLSIPIVPPIEGLDPTMKAYMDWITRNLGPEYLDLFLNGYLTIYARLIGQALLPKLTVKVDVVHRTLMERYRRVTQSLQTNKPQSNKT